MPLHNYALHHHYLSGALLYRIFRIRSVPIGAPQAQAQHQDWEGEVSKDRGNWMVSLDDRCQVTEILVEHSCRRDICDCGPELICRAETPELAALIVNLYNHHLPLVVKTKCDKCDGLGAIASKEHAGVLETCLACLSRGPHDQEA